MMIVHGLANPYLLASHVSTFVRETSNIVKPQNACMIMVLWYGDSSKRTFIPTEIEAVVVFAPQLSPHNTHSRKHQTIESNQMHLPSNYSYASGHHLFHDIAKHQTCIQNRALIHKKVRTYFGDDCVIDAEKITVPLSGDPLRPAVGQVYIPAMTPPRMKRSKDFDHGRMKVTVLKPFRRTES